MVVASQTTTRGKSEENYIKGEGNEVSIGNGTHHSFILRPPIIPVEVRREKVVGEGSGEKICHLDEALGAAGYVRMLPVHGPSAEQGAISLNH
jgi:hypothetical protein